jgi:hypothetical protein
MPNPQYVVRRANMMMTKIHPPDRLKGVVGMGFKQAAGVVACTYKAQSVVAPLTSLRLPSGESLPAAPQVSWYTTLLGVLAMPELHMGPPPYVSCKPSLGLSDVGRVLTEACERLPYAFKQLPNVAVVTWVAMDLLVARPQAMLSQNERR